MSRVEHVEAPEDSSNRRKTMLDLLETFCTGSTTSAEPDDLLKR
jgi:hypothetical protein